MEITSITVPPDFSRRPNSELISNHDGLEKEPAPPKLDRSESTKNVQPDEKQVQAAIAQVNKTLSLYNTRLEFSIHDRTKGIMVKVINETTGELIREVPPERVLDMVAMTWEELGLIVDEKV